MESFGEVAPRAIRRDPDLLRVFEEARKQSAARRREEQLRTAEAQRQHLLAILNQSAEFRLARARNYTFRQLGIK